MLEENEVRGNAIAGVLVASRGAPTLRGNVVCDGGGKGIEFSDGALGRLDNNVRPPPSYHFPYASPTVPTSARPRVALYMEPRPPRRQRAPPGPTGFILTER